MKVFILFFTAMFTSLTVHADENTTRAWPLTQSSETAPYLIPGFDMGYTANPNQNMYKSVINLRAPSTNSPGNIIGNTYNDYQQGGALGRKIALGYPSNEYTHMIWYSIDIPDLDSANFELWYQVYEMGTYAYPAGGIPATYRPKTLEGSLAILADNRAVIANDPYFRDSSVAANIEYEAIPGVFIEHPLRSDTLAGWYVDGMRTIFPATEVHFGTDTVIYVLASAYTPVANWHYFVLYRKVGDGEFDNGQMIESRLGWAYTIVARQSTDSVALIYFDYTVDWSSIEYDRDVVYRLSTDQGLSWGPQTSISNYTSDSMWVANVDVSALWDNNGDLHVVWNDREKYPGGDYCFFKCRLQHWSTAGEHKSIITEARYTAECPSNKYEMNAGKPSLSLCEDKLYTVWTQFNDYDVIDDCGESGYANGELYMSASDDYGLTWDTVVNLTNTRTPGCAPGDCESDIYPSMIRYGAEYPDARDSLDIIYINDKEGGVVAFSQGGFTLNNVMHYRIPCRDVVHLPKITTEPDDLWYPIIIEPDQTMDTSITIINIGNGLLNWEASIDYVSGGEYNWLTIVPSSGAIDIVPNNSGTTILTFNSHDLPGDPSVWEAEVVISASDFPSAVDPDTIHVTLITASDNLQPKADTIDNGCRSLIVYNTGQTGGNNPGYSLNIPGDCDTIDEFPMSDMYLYDASPVIAYVNDANDTIAYTTIFHQSFMDPATFRPLGGFIKSSQTDFDLIKYRAVTVDSSFGIDVTYIVPTDGHCFIMGKNDYYLLDGVTDKSEVCLGAIFDWDIPSDTLADNGSGYDELAKAIWQVGAEYHSDNAGVCNINESDRLGGIAFLDNIKNAWTEDNLAYQESPAYDPAFLYGKMSSNSGYDLYTPGYGEDEFIDLHTGVTFTQTDMNLGDTLSYYFVMITTNQGQADFLSQAAIARDWAIVHTLPPDCMPGDANNDRQVNVGDAVYLISYIFKGGPPPVPYPICSGDANGDCQCNVGDAVYIISYVFKGGPAPVEYLDWYNICGSQTK